MRDSDDDQRSEDQSSPEPAATAETRAPSSAVARMLANPRRVRRS